MYSVCVCVSVRAQTDAYTEKSLTRLENSRLVCKLHDRQKIALCEKRGEEEEEEGETKSRGRREERSDLEEKSQ